MINIHLTNGETIDTTDGDLSFWMQRMSTTDIQPLKDHITGRNVGINPQYIVYVSEYND